MGQGIVFSARSDSHVIGVAAGVDGGADGRRARLSKHTGGQVIELSSKTANIALADGESVRLETSGGGGYGLPAQRKRTLVERDVCDGKVSEQAALALYSVEFAQRSVS